MIQREILKTAILAAAVGVAANALAADAGDTASVHPGEPAAWNIGGGEQDEALHLTPDMENGMDVYEVCAACHLPEGWGTPDGTFPQLAGQHRGVLIKQMADIRAGNRDNPTMYPFTLPQAIGDAQALADVVAYIESLPMNPEWGKGPYGPETEEYALGEQLYQDNCVKCHGETGMGDVEKFYPRINGQHYAYMVRQFEWIRDHKRRNANPEMVEQIKNFSDKDMQAVISYTSWQPVPEEQLADSADWKNPDFE
jgi:cytochrome c553